MPIWLILLLGNQSPQTQISPQLTFKTITYFSSHDKTGPLYADVAFPSNKSALPLLVVMHGYSGNRSAVGPDIRELATKGVFAVAPDMRGCGDSSGKWDSGGLDVHDILDCVIASIQSFPANIDSKNLNIVGYSGGGGNAIATMVRFPDLFQTSTSFFGIADYGGWYHSKGRPDCNIRMEKAIGKNPDEAPEIYLSRNMIPAAGNAKSGIRHFFWDSEETQCPPEMVESFISKQKAVSGDKNTVTHISKPGDKNRWIHGYRSGNKALSKADDLYIPDVLTKREASPKLPNKGRLSVCGYLITRNFQVWIDDGQRGRVEVEYNLETNPPKLQVVDNPGNWPVKLLWSSPLQKLP